jgi:hypothetical protein
MIEVYCFEDIPRTKIPHLELRDQIYSMVWFQFHLEGLIQTATRNLNFIKLKTSDGTSVSKQCAVRLSCTH